MGWQSWLRRWDERNQAWARGDIPEELRRRWRWDRTVDDQGRAALRFRRVTLDEDGARGVRVANPIEGASLWWAHDPGATAP